MKHAMLACVREEHAAAQVFCDLLAEERTQLTRVAFDGLDNVTQRKVELIERMRALGQRRAELQASLGLPVGAAGLDALGETDAACADAVAKLREVALRTRDLNDANGALIASLMNDNRAALAALRSMNAAGLYGPDGRSGASAHGLRIAAKWRAIQASGRMQSSRENG